MWLVILCVVIVRFNVLVGDTIIGPIVPRRGLRQGDLILQYLFILGAKGISAIIRQKESEGKIHGVHVAKTELSISHLFLRKIHIYF